MGFEQIYNAIPKGKENAVHLQQLASRWGVCTKTAKKMIRAARLSGVEICSGIDGYWIAADIVDKNNFIHSLKKQGLERFKTARAINKPSKQIKGQIGLKFEQMGDSGMDG